MKSVIEKLVNHLGLAADATEAVILEKMKGLPGLTAVADLQNSLTQAHGERDALQLKLTAADEAVVAGHLVEFGSVITNDNREFWKGQLMTNRAAALVALKDVLRLKTEGGKPPAAGGTGRQPGPWSLVRASVMVRRMARPRRSGTGRMRSQRPKGCLSRWRSGGRRRKRSASRPRSLVIGDSLIGFKRRNGL